jgi:hypothetical protein
MHHHSCVSGAPSTTTATIWSAGLRAASAIRPPILDQAEILHREEVLMTAKISATAKAFTTRRPVLRFLVSKKSALMRTRAFAPWN